MDLMTLLGAVLALLFHPGSASKINGQKICRRGTERPCYKVSYMQDSWRRLTFEDARASCRVDGGDLLSIESESEQRLIERFIRQLGAGDGDYWIGLRRRPPRVRAGSPSPACPSQYYWLDGSKARFRNWHWDEPSCGSEMCVVLYHQPSAPPDEEGHFIFQWNDDNCNSKNNYVCKYPEERTAVFTDKWNTAHAVTSPRTHLISTTESAMKKGQSESSVSVSSGSWDVAYALYTTIPALLLLLVAALCFVCYKRSQRRKSESQMSRTKPWMSPPPPCPVQGPYAFSDITKLPHAAPDCSIMTKYFGTPHQELHCDDYENLASEEKESAFVTNDIYEICRGQSSVSGWVDNEIYG
ncbi:layilin [Synchiropus splendidus]|uniref:layilin n=1 Tax=Synchiropus splendidus TaxID=270530 RepID=UPI00237E4AD7|nr:layilin [Synchiropus splendidus]